MSYIYVGRRKLPPPRCWLIVSRLGAGGWPANARHADLLWIRKAQRIASFGWSPPSPDLAYLSPKRLFLVCPPISARGQSLLRPANRSSGSASSREASTSTILKCILLGPMSPARDRRLIWQWRRPLLVRRDWPWRHHPQWRRHRSLRLSRHLP